MANLNKPILCNCCGKNKKDSEFYISSSHFNKLTGKLTVCKQCIWEYAEKDGGDLLRIKEALRMIDKPFILDLWKTSKEESERTGKKHFRTYMKNVAMGKFVDYNWSHSEMDIALEDGSVNEQGEKLSHEKYKSLVKQFGKGFSKEDYIWLDEEFTDFTNRYECDSKGMELLIKQICLAELEIETRRAKGEKVDVQLKTLQDLLGSSNLKPVQETGANAVEQETFGTLIKKYENEKPIPEPDPKWKDVDGIKKYIEVFFTGHLARMLGKKDESIEKVYTEEIEKYTVNEPLPEEDGDDNGGL